MWSRPATFHSLVAELRATGIETRALTLPHHDLPPGAAAPAELARLRLQDYVAAIEREAAAMPRRPVLLGHSMGGLLAQLAAVRLQPPGLILLSTGPSATTGALSPAAAGTFWPIVRRWGWWRSATMLPADSARTGVFNGVSEPETKAALAELTWDSGTVLFQMAAPFLDSTAGARVDHARLTMPALVIAGADDRIVPAAVSRNTARKLPGAVDYEEWPGVGHWLFHDAVRPRVAAAVARFLASLSAN